jgi:two-component system CheB/CheR fusion protein
MRPEPGEPDDALEALLVHLRDMRGFDFTGYRRAGLARRVRRRMDRVGIDDVAAYLEHLELNPDEFTALFDTVLINVTAFFRDPDAWQHLRTEVLPGLLAGIPAGRQVRVWSAGCASGEEAYTLAIVLAELLGPEDFRSRVKVYATDVDEDALAHARQALYDERQLAGVPGDLRARYFDRVGPRYQVRGDLRRRVVFGRNDLVQDAPISRIHLLVCRNTLMYLTAETQARILARFHFALDPAGVLLLGRAEMLLGHDALFRPLDLPRRVFGKVAAAGSPPSYVAAAAGPAAGSVDRLRDQLLMSGPVAQVVVTADGVVALVNERAEAVLGVSARDRGRPFRDLELSYRPVELRRFIELAQAERRTVQVEDVVLARPGAESTVLEVLITPVIDDGEVLGVAVTFHDVTAARRLQDELRRAHSRVEAAYEELQSTNEELETTNEELQSTVEELETINEELHSINDELRTLNDELQDRTGQLDEANGFLESILTGLRAGVVVLGPDLAVREWNQQAEELWGLRREEVVGRPFLGLDIGLPLDRLRPMIRRALDGDTGSPELGVAAVNRRGRTVGMRVLSSALHGQETAPTGVILMMEQDR